MNTGGSKEVSTSILDLALFMIAYGESNSEKERGLCVIAEIIVEIQRAMERLQ